MFGSLKIATKRGTQFSFDDFRAMANIVLRKVSLGSLKFPRKNVQEEGLWILNIKSDRVLECGVPSRHLDNWDPIFERFFCFFL